MGRGRPCPTNHVVREPARATAISQPPARALSHGPGFCHARPCEGPQSNPCSSGVVSSLTVLIPGRETSSHESPPWAGVDVRPLQANCNPKCGPFPGSAPRPGASFCTERHGGPSRSANGLPSTRQLPGKQNGGAAKRTSPGAHQGSWAARGEAATICKPPFPPASVSVSWKSLSVPGEDPDSP